MSAHREDFVTYSPLKQEKSIQGIADSLTIKGQGLVRYILQAENGELITIQAKGYYVPKLSPEVRLISPQGVKTLGGKYVGVFVNPSMEEDPEAEV